MSDQSENLFYPEQSDSESTEVTDSTEGSAIVVDEVEQVESDDDVEDSGEVESSDADTVTKKADEQEPVADTSDSEEDSDETKLKLERVKLEIKGQEYELDLPADIAQIAKSGFLMQDKFTQNSQALADERRKFTAESEAKLKQQSDSLTELGAQLMFTQHQLESQEMEDLKEFNRPEYDKIKLRYDQNLQTYNKFVNETADAELKRQQDQDNAFRAEEAEKLETLIPEWLDKETYLSDYDQVNKYAKSVGVPDDIVSGIKHASVARVYRDAMMWNQSQGRVKSSKKKPVITNVKASAKTTAVKSKAREDHFY